MFRLDNILERWAELYRPLRHNAPIPGNSPEAPCRRTFFRISMIDAQSYFIRNFAKQPSPAMAYVTHIDTELPKQNRNAINYRHVVYFLAKQQNADGKTDVTDEEAATEARFLTDQMTQDLLTVLFTLKSMANGKTIPADVAAALPAAVTEWMRQTAADTQYAEGLRGLQLEEATWGTLPTHLNGWQICGLTIEQVTPRQKCINAARY